MLFKTKGKYITLILQMSKIVYLDWMAFGEIWYSGRICAINYGS